MAGIRFGKLVPIEIEYIKNKRIYWKCICDCGNVKNVFRGHLIGGGTKSCGCALNESKLKDLTGRKFGKLTVIGFNCIKIDKSKRRSAYFDCICDCGNSKVLQGCKISFGHTKSCGCLKTQSLLGKNNSNWTGHEDISGSYFKSLSRSANNRGFDFYVSIEQLWEIFQNQNGLCAYTGRKIHFGKNQTASLDRIDSKAGYVIGNIQWVHKEINIFKINLQHDKFIELCNEVSTFSKKRNKK